MNEGDEWVCELTVYGNYEPVDELVRCKDCKNYDQDIEDCKMMVGYDWSFSPEDYCSYGVRKDA